MTVNEFELESVDISIVRVVRSSQLDLGRGNGASPHLEAAFSDEVIVLLDTQQLPELFDDGLPCDIVNREQRMCKQAGLVPTDTLPMQYEILAQSKDSNFERAVEARWGIFESALR